MRKLYNLIQSPAALFAFEAAARLKSFTEAAKELNVSQPAISLAVKKIETALGTKMFDRKHRRIELNETGERFYTDVSFGLMHILRSAEAISILRTGNHVTLSCSTAFAHYWVVPRMASFRNKYKDIDIRLQTTDRDVDPDHDNISLSVRRGNGEWAGYDSFLLAKERIYPVCSPAYLASIKPPKTPIDLIGHNLIHLEEPYRLRPKWADWFAAQGVEFQDKGDGLRLNDYALVIQAAIAGEGIAYGWHHQVEDLIKKGLLVKVMDGDYNVGQGFYVISSKQNPVSEQALKVRDWLLAQKNSIT